VVTPIWLWAAFHRQINKQQASQLGRLFSRLNPSKWCRPLILRKRQRYRRTQWPRPSEMKIIKNMILFRNSYVIPISFLKWFFHQINNSADLEEGHDHELESKANIMQVKVLNINKGRDTLEKWW
jgi:hypothetical protein